MPDVTDRASRGHSQRGFTLAELAIVLVIITILAAALMVPISGQIESRQRKQTDDALARIESALIGFAILNRRLPCPTIETNPAASAYGEEALYFDTFLNEWKCHTASEGMLPWRTLGLGAHDAWGTPRTATSDPWTGYWRYRVDTRFAVPLPPPAPHPYPITLDTELADHIDVFDHGGAKVTASRAEAVALFYSTGADRIPNGQNAAYEAGSHPSYEQGEPTTTFDDMVRWFGRPLLIARMAEAGVF